MAAVLAGGYYANDSGRRLFLWAVAASLALHLAVLFILPVLRSAASAPGATSLTARLAKPQPPEPALPKFELPAQPAERPRPPPAAKAVPQPARVPAAPERVQSVEPEKQTVESAAVAPVAPAAPPPAVPQLPAASGPIPAPSRSSARVDGPRAALQVSAHRAGQQLGRQSRPAHRDRENGAISSLTVKKGTGRAVLDDEAQAMIRTAKAKAAIPPGLRGKAFNLEISVDFFLKDEEK
jgi:TonB family protein